MESTQVQAAVEALLVKSTAAEVLKAVANHLVSSVGVLPKNPAGWQLRAAAKDQGKRLCVAATLLEVAARLEPQQLEADQGEAVQHPWNGAKVAKVNY